MFRDASEFVMLEGCVDLTGDGAVELVLRRPDGTGAGSTEVVALEATPRTLFKVPFDLELRKTRTGPFPYELVNDDGIVFTEPQLPLVFAYRSGRFERIGSNDRDYWNGRRELVKKVLECNAKMPGPMPRAFVNLWFSASLYLGDWDDAQKSFPIDPTQLLELELARPLLVRALDGDASLPPLPPNVWLASKGAPAEITKALARLATLPAPAETTDVESIAASDDTGTPPPPGFRFLNVPKAEGTVLERCGNTVVEQVSDDELRHYVRLRADDGRYVGRIVPAERIGHAAAEWCFDLTGDGVPELLVTESSGGAHCCHTFRVLALGATPGSCSSSPPATPGSRVPKISTEKARTSSSGATIFSLAMRVRPRMPRRTSFRSCSCSRTESTFGARAASRSSSSANAKSSPPTTARKTRAA